MLTGPDCYYAPYFFLYVRLYLFGLELLPWNLLRYCVLGKAPSPILLNLGNFLTPGILQSYFTLAAMAL